MEVVGRTARSSVFGNGAIVDNRSGDGTCQQRGVALVQHGTGVDARHPAQVGYRVDDHVEVVPPVALRGDQDLGAARPVDEHLRILCVLVDDVLAAVDRGQVGRLDDIVGDGVVGRQVQRVAGPKTRTPQGVDESVRGEGLAPRRTDRHPVAQRQSLRPEAVHAGSVAGRVDREHLAASCPHRAAGRRELAPVGTRTRRPGRTHGVTSGGEGFGNGVGTRPGCGDWQAGHPAGELDVTVEVEAGDRRRYEDVGGPRQGGLTLLG
jgi:hypothetical protein